MTDKNRCVIQISACLSLGSPQSHVLVDGVVADVGGEAKRRADTALVGGSIEQQRILKNKLFTPSIATISLRRKITDQQIHSKHALQNISYRIEAQVGLHSGALIAREVGGVAGRQEGAGGRAVQAGTGLGAERHAEHDESQKSNQELEHFEGL